MYKFTQGNWVDSGIPSNTHSHTHGVGCEWHPSTDVRDLSHTLTLTFAQLAAGEKGGHRTGSEIEVRVRTSGAVFLL